MNNYIRLFLLFCLLFTVNTVSAQKTVKDLQYPYLQNYAWISLTEIVPEITDRIILPIGTGGQDPGIIIYVEVSHRDVS